MSEGLSPVTGTTGDGSGAAVVPPGTPAVGSTEATTLQQQVAELNAKLERVENANRQLLSEKTTTEEMRRQAEAVLAQQVAQRDNLARLHEDLASEDLAVRTSAQQYVINTLGE